MKTKSVLGTPLPNARLVSRAVIGSEPAPDSKYSLMLMQWGQLLDHDLTHSPETHSQAGEHLPCTACSPRHPACSPVPVEEGDEHFPVGSCIRFTRSMPGQRGPGPREQINQVSAYIDASMLYGSDHCTNRKVRVKGSPLLRSNPSPYRSLGGKRLKPLLPLEVGRHDCMSSDRHCFHAGDLRVNEQPGLTCLHTVLLREHNRVAEELATINPHWEAERTYEETRRVVAALVQHITYAEFLPRVLGRRQARLYSLGSPAGPGAYYRGYSAQCSADIYNEFATAAFRFGHSMIRPNLSLISEEEMRGGHGGHDGHSGHDLGRSEPLRRHFNNPGLVREAGTVDSILRGLVMMPMEAVDSRVTDEVSNHLFQGERVNRRTGRPASLDLVAINIQRGRDHGLPGYNAYRQVCRLPRAEEWADLEKEIPVELVVTMRGLYKHPDDVDLFPGLLAERKLPGAMVGPTLACLLGSQFTQLRRCDRFWHETADPALRFQPAQLAEIRAASLAALVCRNMDDNDMHRSAFDMVSPGRNPVVSCGELRQLDLEPWREAEVCSSGPGPGGEPGRPSPCTTCRCTREGLRCQAVTEPCSLLVGQFGAEAVRADPACAALCSV